MKINILIVAVIVITLLSACKGSDARMNETIQAELMSNKPYEVDMEAIAPGSWGLFGTMTVFDYQKGRIINHNTPGAQPYYVMNRVDDMTDTKIVTTEPGEVKAGIPLTRTLWVNPEYQDEIFNVLRIESSIDEKLEAVGYDADENLLIIDGFIPNVQRTLKITYRPIMGFRLSLTNDRKPLEEFAVAPDGFEEWVTVIPERMTLKPGEYAPVWVMLHVPEEVKKLPDAWEFWLRLELDEPVNAGEIITTIQDGEAVIKSKDGMPGLRGTTASSLPYRVIMR